MDVQSANLSLSVFHSSVSIDRSAQRRQPLATLSPALPARPERVRADVELTPQARQAAESETALREVLSDPRFAALVDLIERLTGEALRLFGFEPAATTAASAPADAPPPAPAASPAAATQVVRERLEAESTTVNLQGRVLTADGVEIEFSLQLQMQRYFHQLTTVAAPAAARRDPLVLNFAGHAAELLDRRFQFDLDADGRLQALPQLAAGSALLVFDRNGNGRIDDGRELFGARSGNGFAELAALDADGDGWIDAADPAFARLQLWRPGGDGGDLLSLAEAGVGALATQHIASPFELRGRGNSELGGVRATGLYLTEAGRVGSLQQIDYSV